VLLILGNWKSSMLDVCFNLRRIKVNEGCPVEQLADSSGSLR
jgi:hypothetical protein